MTVTYNLYIDFNRDGFGSEDNIGPYLQDADWTIGFSDEYENFAAENTLNATLNNVDKRFSPEYSSGAYFGSIYPKLPVRLESVSSLGTISHYTGWLDTIEPESGRGRTARLRAVGMKKYLDQHEFKTELLTDVKAGTVIGTIMHKVREWSPATNKSFILDHSDLGLLDGNNNLTDLSSGNLLEDGEDTFPYIGDGWEDGISASRAIADLCAGERGYFWVSREGSAVFKGRRYFPNITTVTGTVNDDFNMNYKYGSDIVNRAIVVVYPRSISATNSELLWQNDEEIEITGGRDKKVRARFKEDDSDVEISGRNFQALDIAWTPKRRKLTYRFEPDTRSAEIILENRHPNRSVTIPAQGIKIYGQKITRQKPEEIVREDSDSIGQYGLSEFRIDTTMMNSYTLGDSLAFGESVKRSTPKGIMNSVSFRNRPNEANITKILNWTIGKRIRVQDTQTAHDSEYIIIGERHRLHTAARVHDVTYDLRIGAHTDGFVLDDNTLGLLDGTNRLGAF